MEGKIYVQAPPSQLSDSKSIVDGDGPYRRLYQIWTGSNRFVLGGRLIFGPSVKSLYFTLFLIVVPVLLFSVFVSQRLVDEFDHNLSNLVIAIAIAFTAFVLFLLLLTSSRDPGIVPRNLHPPEPEEDGDASVSSADWIRNSSGTHGLPPTKDVVVNGIVVKVKYCHTCMLYRPPRTSHCSVCDNCVERFDHHCPWVGQCIGKRNYRYFFMFVFSTTLLCLYVFAFCWVNLKKIMEAYKFNLWKAMLESPISGVLIIYTFIAAWFVGGLTAFHMYLICTNQTTYENFRYRYDKNTNPYNRGCIKNIKEVFFTRIPNSKNNFRAKVKVDSAFSKPSLSLGQALSPAKKSVDLEMGGKRQAVAEEEFEDIQSQIDGVGGLERCGRQPAHTSWGNQKGNWEITSDLNALAVELGMEHGLAYKEKIQGKF